MLAGESPKPTQALLTQAKAGQAKPTEFSFASYSKAKQTEEAKQTKPSTQSKVNQATQASEKNRPKQNKQPIQANQAQA